ncbi:hypothetical protein [Marinobacter salsuginis]|mgnify:FL=1|jgi:hypothetical protein|uniref:hypothetical protein n=1 Tax=Marinobacter salsuginis TaxID=418719 RepID=UPI00273E67ED|nr:hypothetical protein [Marinobacter salsuginis]|tara:strand:- start:5488 stop:5733 length:246 start_codon:yes stop_codon:yes gene_type:complete
MNRWIKCATVPAMAFALTACFDGSSGGGSAPEGEMLEKVGFAEFVEGIFADPNPNREPEQVNNKEFVFNDQANDQAFDSLL